MLGLKLRNCQQRQQWNLCLGAHLRLTGQPFDADGGEQMSQLMTALINQMHFRSYWPDTYALEPLLALEAGRGDFSLRLVLGPSLELFLDDDQQLEGDAAEVVLLYSLEATARVAEALQLFAGVRGLSMLSTSPLLSTLMLSFGGAVRLDRFSPFIRITVPVQGFFPSAVVLACGAGAQF